MLSTDFDYKDRSKKVSLKIKIDKTKIFVVQKKMATGAVVKASPNYDVARRLRK